MPKDNEEKTWTLFTDGSCIKNPGGAGGWACVIITPSNAMVKLSGYNPHTTNQQMELSAVIQGLMYIPDGSSIDVYTDSAYVANGFNKKWVETWVNNGWKNSKGEPVANIDLWKLLRVAFIHRNVRIYWVKGHADNPLNNECDRMAREIIDFNIAMKDIDFIK